MPLNPSGNTPTTSPERSSTCALAGQARVCPDLRASGPSSGTSYDQVGAQQPQVPAGRVLVVQAGLEHDRVDGQRAGVVGDHQRGAGLGHVRQTAHLDAEPALVEDPGHRHQHAAVELRVETELVDLGLAVELAARELKGIGDPAPPAARPGGDTRRAGDDAVVTGDTAVIAGPAAVPGPWPPAPPAWSRAAGSPAGRRASSRCPSPPSRRAWCRRQRLRGCSPFPLSSFLSGIAGRPGAASRAG